MGNPPGPGFEVQSSSGSSQGGCESDVSSVRLESGAYADGVSVRTRDGRWVRLHSRRDPVAEAHTLIADAFTGGEPPLVIAIGLGLGYLLDAVDARSGLTKVLALEPVPSTLAHLLERPLPQRWIETGRLRVFSGPDYVGASDAWRLVEEFDRNPPVVVHPVLKREFVAEAARAHVTAIRIIQGAQANQDARRRFAGRYLLNTIRNLPVIAAESDAAALSGLFSRVPAVVVGAGPSLDGTIRDLRMLDGRVLVVSTDTAMRPLLHAGIQAHIAVAVDPSEANGRHLADLVGAQQTWLVAEGSVDARVYPVFAGRTFTFRVSDHHPWPWLREKGCHGGTLRCWGSVLTAAFDLACQAGCDPIVFIGADLAYTDGLPYCRNTIYEREWSHLHSPAELSEAFLAGLVDRPTCTESDVQGKPVLTAPHFIQFRDWLVARAQDAVGRRILNATGGGILQGPGITQVDLATLSLPGRDETWRERLTAAWQEGLANPEELQQLVFALGAGTARVPLGDWLAFGAGQVSPEQISTCLDLAARGVGASGG